MKIGRVGCACTAGARTADRRELEQTADWIAAQQLPSGEILWFVGGKTDPWDHVHAAMGLAVAGRHARGARPRIATSPARRTRTARGRGEWRGETREQRDARDQPRRLHRDRLLAPALRATRRRFARGAVADARARDRLRRAHAGALRRRSPGRSIRTAKPWRAPLLTGIVVDPRQPGVRRAHRRAPRSRSSALARARAGVARLLRHDLARFDEATTCPSRRAATRWTGTTRCWAARCAGAPGASTCCTRSARRRSSRTASAAAASGTVLGTPSPRPASWRWRSTRSGSPERARAIVELDARAAHRDGRLLDRHHAPRPHPLARGRADHVDRGDRAPRARRARRRHARRALSSAISRATTSARSRSRRVRRVVRDVARPRPALVDDADPAFDV